MSSLFDLVHDTSFMVWNTLNIFNLNVTTNSCCATERRSSPQSVIFRRHQICQALGNVYKYKQDVHKTSRSFPFDGTGKPKNNLDLNVSISLTSHTVTYRQCRITWFFQPYSNNWMLWSWTETENWNWNCDQTVTIPELSVLRHKIFQTSSYLHFKITFLGF